MFRPAAIAASATLLLLGGCATLGGSNQQTVMVQTILDHHEVIGAGCVVSNDAGKWFVTTPAPLSIRKSAGPLRVDCRKDGTGMAEENIASTVNGSLWTDTVLTVGVGYFVDRSSGAGFDYPATLTIELHRAEEAPAPANSAPAHIF
jgi:hypothetical protein